MNSAQSLIGLMPTPLTVNPSVYDFKVTEIGGSRASIIDEDFSTDISFASKAHKNRVILDKKLTKEARSKYTCFKLGLNEIRDFESIKLSGLRSGAPVVEGKSLLK